MPARSVLVPALALLAAVPAPLAARAPKPVEDFYRAKREAVSPAAFARAEPRLRSLTPGMSEGQVLAALAMAVLSRKGMPQDVSIDGYLAEASARRNDLPGRDPEVRYLVFGSRRDGRDQPRATVVLRARRLVEVLWEAPEPALAAATLPAPAETERQR